MAYFLIKQKKLIPTLKRCFFSKSRISYATVKMGFSVGIDIILGGLGGILLVWIMNNNDSTLNRFMFFFINLPEFGFRMYSGYILAVTKMTVRSFSATNIKKSFRIMRFGLRDTLLISTSISLLYLIFPDFIACYETLDFLMTKPKCEMSCYSRRRR